MYMYGIMNKSHTVDLHKIVNNECIIMVTFSTDNLCVLCVNIHHHDIVCVHAHGGNHRCYSSMRSYNIYELMDCFEQLVELRRQCIEATSEVSHSREPLWSSRA